jgi:PadR family transcriptional regulator, regulatory protein PadR
MVLRRTKYKPHPHFSSFLLVTFSIGGRPTYGTVDSLPMTREKTNERMELFQGTLDLLILRTLRWGPKHGYGIAKFIEQTSSGAFQVDHGSLYPALQRLQQEGWIKANWGVSTTKRKAKFYSLTASGRKQLVAGQSHWKRFISAFAAILQTDRPAPEEK